MALRDALTQVQERNAAAAVGEEQRHADRRRRGRDDGGRASGHLVDDAVDLDTHRVELVRRAAGSPRIGPRHCCARAWRDGEVVCGRVELTVREDARLGLAPRERRRVAARFVGQLHPALRRELTELVRRRGAFARRAAERMDPIELVVDDPDGGLARIVGWVQAPQRRHGDPHEIEFDLREPAS